MKRILINKEGKIFFVKDSSKDYHTEFGLFSKKDLSKTKGKIKTNKKKEFSIFEPMFADLYDWKKRNAQIMLKKDIGWIIAETGVNKESFIVDAGAGSGGACCAFANIAKEVVTYEPRKEFVKTVEDNISLMGLTNIKLKNQEISKINEKNVDLINLDLPDPEKYLAKCVNSLKNGGFLTVYLPSITQVSKLVKTAQKEKELIYLKTVELIERKWKIDGKIARPEFRMLGHTGFISFFRRV